MTASFLELVLTAILVFVLLYALGQRRTSHFQAAAGKVCLVEIEVPLVGGHLPTVRVEATLRRSAAEVKERTGLERTAPDLLLARDEAWDGQPRSLMAEQLTVRPSRGAGCGRLLITGQPDPASSLGVRAECAFPDPARCREIRRQQQEQEAADRVRTFAGMPVAELLRCSNEGVTLAYEYGLSSAMGVRLPPDAAAWLSRTGGMRDLSISENIFVHNRSGAVLGLPALLATQLSYFALSEPHRPLPASRENDVNIAARTRYVLLRHLRLKYGEGATDLLTRSRLPPGDSLGEEPNIYAAEDRFYSEVALPLRIVEVYAGEVHVKTGEWRVTDDGRRGTAEIVVGPFENH